MSLMAVFGLSECLAILFVLTPIISGNPISDHYFYPEHFTRRFTSDTRRSSPTVIPLGFIFSYHRQIYLHPHPQLILSILTLFIPNTSFRPSVVLSPLSVNPHFNTFICIPQLSLCHFGFLSMTVVIVITLPLLSIPYTFNFTTTVRIQPR